MSLAPAIDLQNLQKTYAGGVQALRGVDLFVGTGEVFGLLGPNGAGKSTLVKVMLTVVRPTCVTGTVLGEPVGHQATLGRIGYLPEHHRFPPYLTGRQVVELFGALAGMDRAPRRRRAAELLDTVGMGGWSSRKLGTYSKGMQQRIGLAAALINDPALVVLDEPTDGVDPVGRREIRDVLARIRDEGRTVLINSHLLSEVELICTQVAIMVQGRVVQRGTVEALTRDSARYEVLLRQQPPAWTLEVSLGARVENGAGIHANSAEQASAEGTPSLFRLVLPQLGSIELQGVLDRLRNECFEIVAVTPMRESLEDLFIRAVKDPETGKAFAPGAAR
ncbi:MAG: ABC transporter ATP-binding protein [Planctomycetota bacterium]|nr:ABC transporter ATP-binding protein [Planctomycetota bacterium]